MLQPNQTLYYWFQKIILIHCERKSNFYHVNLI